jgi:hypothetical protein
MSEAIAEPAPLIARREALHERMSGLNSALNNITRRRDKAAADGDEDAEFALTLQIAEVLTRQASTTEFLHDLERETIIEFYAREEREAKRRPESEAREGDVVVVRDAPAGLDGKSAHEIIHELRNVRNWTYQQVVDYLHANGVKKKRGGEHWNTSDVYAIAQRGKPKTQ